ncbi:MAG: hypothetical protein WCO65_02045 [bacterium]
MIPVDPKPFQKIHTTLVRAVLFAVLCLIGYGYFFFVVHQTRQNVALLTRETAVLENEQSQSSQIKSQLNQTDERRSTLVSYFIDVKNPVPFEETIEGYGIKTNTTVLFNGLEVKKDPARLDTSFTVEGSFADMYHFFALLESAPYDFSISNLNIQTSVPVGFQPAGKGIHTKNDWQARVLMSVYSISNTQ